jgi:hypothetical protein
VFVRGGSWVNYPRHLRSAFRNSGSTVTVGERIQKTALDALEALIEATYTKERTQHLRQANLGIEKLRFLLRLAADPRLLDRRCSEDAVRVLDETGRLIGGWMKVRNASTAMQWAD